MYNLYSDVCMNKNRGWGLKTELIWIAVFVICLITALIGVFRMGFLSNLNEALNPNYYSNTNTSTNKTKKTLNSKSSIEIDTSTKPETSIDSTSSFSYTLLESRVQDAAQLYVNDVYNNNLGLDTLIIKVSVLKSSGYIDSLNDGDDYPCSGYVEVNAIGDSIKYDPFIKCSNYETTGYIERRDE